MISQGLTGLNGITTHFVKNGDFSVKKSHCNDYTKGPDKMIENKERNQNKKNFLTKEKNHLKWPHLKHSATPFSIDSIITKKNLTKKLKFDHSLSFKNQVEFLKKNCQQRLSCLKILSHKSWKLSKNTLKQIYFALVRSLLDYSSRIQNCAIKLNYRENTQNIHTIAGIKVLEDRYRELNENYLSDSIQNKNPSINDLINEYKLFKRGKRKNLFIYSVISCLRLTFINPLFEKGAPSTY
ncbi:pol-like protein [Brachionus plicatilis]|uniref:Pol-like protein n=1 Tax=Brachionus plicatilis TaxID=10195 RepID=A0A3M7Q021_BRAPC|nr:pol-like protein [Brachionus plicatilis]